MRYTSLLGAYVHWTLLQLFLLVIQSFFLMMTSSLTPQDFSLLYAKKSRHFNRNDDFDSLKFLV